MLTEQDLFKAARVAPRPIVKEEPKQPPLRKAFDTAKDVGSKIVGGAGAVAAGAMSLAQVAPPQQMNPRFNTH